MEHLIVEDSDIHRFILRKYLNKIGCHTKEAKSGLEALDLVRKHGKYHVIWTDINLPKLNGIETTEKLRNELKYKGPIVGITGFCDVDSLKCCKDAGMNDVLAKPLEFSKLKQCVKKYSVV